MSRNHNIEITGTQASIVPDASFFFLAMSLNNVYLKPEIIRVWFLVCWLMVLFQASFLLLWLPFIHNAGLWFVVCHVLMKLSIWIEIFFRLISECLLIDLATIAHSCHVVFCMFHMSASWKQTLKICIHRVGRFYCEGVEPIARDTMTSFVCVFLLLTVGFRSPESVWWRGKWTTKHTYTNRTQSQYTYLIIVIYELLIRSLYLQTQ